MDELHTNIHRLTILFCGIGIAFIITIATNTISEIFHRKKETAKRKNIKINHKES